MEFAKFGPQAFGHDYRDGTMRLVLSTLPRRIPVFIAKLIVPAVLIALTMALTQLIALGQASALGMTGGTEEALAMAARSVVPAVWWGLMVAAITVLLRNLAAGIIVPLIMSTIVEVLIQGQLGSRIPWLADATPFVSAIDWTNTGAADEGLTALAWVAVLLGLAAVLFVRRDA